MSASKWGFQIKKEDEWLWVSSSSGVRYEYDTRDEAYSMSYMCYPDQWRETRLGGVATVRVRMIKDDS